MSSGLVVQYQADAQHTAYLSYRYSPNVPSMLQELAAQPAAQGDISLGIWIFSLHVGSLPSSSPFKLNINFFGLSLSSFLLFPSPHSFFFSHPLSSSLLFFFFLFTVHHSNLRFLFLLPLFSFVFFFFSVGPWLSQPFLFSVSWERLARWGLGGFRSRCLASHHVLPRWPPFRTWSFCPTVKCRGLLLPPHVYSERKWRFRLGEESYIDPSLIS